MSTLTHYKQTYPTLQRVWDKFDKLLDKKVFFFNPKSHNERIKQYTQEVDTNAEMAVIQTQVDIYDKRPWYSKVWFWLFDIGDISVKKNWLSYHSFRQQTHFDSLTDNIEVTLPHLETLKSEINTHLSSLGRSSWRKVVQRFLQALGNLLTTEQASSAIPAASEVDQNHPTPEAAMQKHNSKPGNKDQDALIAHYGEHLRKKKSANIEKDTTQKPKSQFTSPSSVDEKGITTSTAAPTSTRSSNSSATLSSQASGVLVMSRGDGTTIQASADDKKSYEEACWSYVFCCSFFALDWREQDKDVLRQKFNTARHALQLKIHPDKLPLEKFPLDWNNRERWMGYLRDGRTDSFNKVGMVAEGLQVLLDNIVPYPTEEYQQSIGGQRKLAEAAHIGSEFRQEVFKKIAAMETVVELREGTERLEDRARRADETSARMRAETQRIEQRGDFLASIVIQLPGGKEELARIDAELAGNQRQQETTTSVGSQIPTTEPERLISAPYSTTPESKVTSPATQALIAQWQQQGPPGSSQDEVPTSEHDTNPPTPAPILSTPAKDEVDSSTTRRKSICSPC